MAQRDKVKELVGRGLNSYHTKALQQMDRIEKKNKEQNHKISILSNELDNDYLTKTEEGSVVSLEHSKEGMVYLDELQGNTLVNYCTDGSKEMTLNGDIDVEGVLVTTTEGVDNGKVDVMCEGNTLVNLLTDGFKTKTWTNAFETTETTLKLKFTEKSYPTYGVRPYNLKPNTKYTFIVDVDGVENIDSGYWCLLRLGEGDGKTNVTFANPTKNGKHVVCATTPNVAEISDLQIFTRPYADKKDSVITLSNPILLEGDWTNREIPTSFFKSMKSVGQDDESGHKIEILSQNKNLVVNSNVVYTFENYNDANRKSTHTTINFTSNFKNIIRNKKIILGVKAKGENLRRLEGVPQINGDFHYGFDMNVKYADGTSQWLSLTTETLPSGTFEETYYTREFVIPDKEILEYSSNQLFCRSTYGKLILSEPMVMIVDDNTIQKNFVPHSLNKKEILMNEPLRGLPSGSKDKIIKIGGKYFIERNIRQKLLTGTDSEEWLIHSNSDENVIEFRCNTGSPFITNNSGSTISDKFIGKSGGNVDRIAWAGDTVYITISRNRLATVDVAGLRQWLSNNNVLVQNQLATPIYEPLEVEPTLLTYNDVTHISNNSIIPCTMKIKNTGYNVIIKPSTLYTIALDTNKSGTIGMNLGGAKVTTTNNVATVTTPATLTDDSLRLYGKGIKGSKVRLLEGDKTNWIPSHFEGMKSSFEDKLQDDGSYKMEILSNNKNLWVVNNKTAQKDNLTVEFDHDTQIITVNGVCNIDDLYIYQGREYIIKDIPKNEMDYTLSYEIVSGSYDITNSIRNSFGYIGISSREFGTIINISGLNMSSENSVSFKMKNQPNNTWFRLDKGTVFNNLKLKISLEPCIRKTDYVKPSFNKIQFSSIEPLRGSLDKFKDRLIFKNEKLMIERNCIYKEFNGADMTGWFMKTSDEENKKTRLFQIYIANTLPSNGHSVNKIIKCDRFASKPDLWHKDEEGIHKYYDNTLIQIRINKSKAQTLEEFKQWMIKNPIKIVCALKEPTYEEIPFELQKIILEGYENGTLFFDTNIPPTSTVTYAGETPIVKATKLNKTEVLNNTNDINDNIIPYLMDMDYRVVCLQLATEEIEGGVSMARLFGGAYEMLKRDILSKRLSRQEYGYRLADYFNAGKLTEEQVRELEDLR